MTQRLAQDCFRMTRLRNTRLVLACLLFAAVAQATTFTVTVTSGNGQFPAKQAAAFGPTTQGTLTLNLTPNVPVTFPVDNFTGFQGLDVFPATPGANTMFQQ